MRFAPPRFTRWLAVPAVLAGCLAALWAAARVTVWAQDALRTPPPSFAGAEPCAGEPAPDFALEGPDGGVVRLSDWRGRMPVVVEFGSFTCPYSVRSAGPMECLAEKYRGKVQFLFVYTKEAHPGQAALLPGGGSTPSLPQTSGPAARRERAVLFRDDLKLGRLILLDGDGGASAQERYGDLPNPVFVVDARGRLAFKAPAVYAPLLDALLSGLVGPPPPEARSADSVCEGQQPTSAE